MPGPALLLLAALAPAPAAAPLDAGVREFGCRVMRPDPSGKIITEAAPDLHVLQGAAGAGAFQPELPAGTQAIMCGRDSIIPAEHDDEVLALGLPLFIAEQDEEGRLAALEISEGQYRFRFLHGALRPGEVPLLQARLDLFQARSQSGK
jgi:hypothetical protein